MDPQARYREYLATFGIAQPGDRVAELRDRDVGNVRFFAYADGNGLRLKAAVTPSGVVTPGAHEDDDWSGFLFGMPDAESAAERIAWLESDASMQPHGLPVEPAAALAPSQPTPPGVEPAHWALVTAPELRAHPDGDVAFVAWLLPSGTRIPERWTIRVRANARAAIERAAASDVPAP